jgi:hypothetical protein
MTPGLDGEDWPGGGLAGALVRFRDAGGASLASVDARDSVWDHCSLRRADLQGADLRGATLVGCDLERANLVDARLSDARLVRCSLASADLTGSDLEDATMVGCDLAGAELAGARNAATARDLVVEHLRRHAGDDVELLRWVGLVAIRRDWCWEEWVPLLAAEPRVRAAAMAAFAAAPHAGFTEAYATATRVAKAL